MHVLVEEFAEDPRTAEWLDDELAQIERNKVVRDGTTYMFTPSYGTLAAIARLRPSHRLIPELLTDAAQTDGQTWHTFHEWTELTATTTAGAQEFIGLAVEISRIVRLNDQFPDYIHRPLAARLRRDTDLAPIVAELVPGLSEAASGIAVRLLALSGHLDGPLADHLRTIARGAYHGTAATFDPFTGDTSHIELLALDILDTLDK